ncbi:unnamed protein product [Porites lobata]|uniref:Uncharacterized protein n=1 Tax=Porites lobata TaxID=104759 RepID=A0ABN8S9R7_9CNID|nr:unnamed protein product [Porites lobata]
MSTSQSNRQASEFRTILSRINEIKTSLQGSDREEVSKKLDEMNDSLRIIEGNQADFSDAMFKAVERMQKSVEDGFKALESRIVALEARLDQSTDSTSALTSPTSSLLRKRKITRHPDLSHYIRSKMDQLGLSWDVDKKENEAPNHTISTTLLKEVQEIEQIKNDSTCTERRVLDAISQNLASSKKRKRQEEKGTYEQYQQEQKRRQRIKRKLDKRLKAVTEEERDGDLFSALHVSLVSSEESDTEDNSLRTRPLSWRTENVNNFFKLLDGRAKAAMTSQQRRQSVSRRQGVASGRGTDTVPEHLKWAVCDSP